MNTPQHSSTVALEPNNTAKNHAETPLQPRGFIVFCEKKLRYEKGLKAWIVLGPYFLGVVGLEIIIMRHGNIASTLVSWIGLLTYLVLFPSLWRWILQRLTWRKSIPVTSAR